jgi:hypothetical protein
MDSLRPCLARQVTELPSMGGWSWWVGVGRLTAVLTRRRQHSGRFNTQLDAAGDLNESVP